MVIIPITDLTLPSLSGLDVVSKTLPFNEKNDFIFFMKNNIYALLMLISGSVMFGLTTFTVLFFNGFVLGAIVCSMLKSGVPSSTILLLTFPHGIFEFPSIWIAGAAGFKIPYELVQYFSNKKDYILNRDEILDFLTLVTFAIVLLIIAAFIEANITMKITENIITHQIM
jgi:uncharacterized membrane protein SpoIIM required for sporulation